VLLKPPNGSNPGMVMKSDGDVQEALAQLSEPVFLYLRRYCGDEQLAEDLAQETLLRVARALPDFDGRSTLKTWAIAIATRVAADHYRCIVKKVPEVNLEEYEALPADETSLEQQLVVDEMNTCIRQVIDTLPEEYRAALVLRDMQGLAVKEVAEVLDCSLANAKIRIHRARKRLQDALNNQCSFYNDQENVFRCERK
jgi:RNA polymerase sigma-70 factor, ECF subfamily